IVHRWSQVQWPKSCSPWDRYNLVPIRHDKRSTSSPCVDLVNNSNRRIMLKTIRIWM
ncbi:hypothetical protein KI387_001018, partial [Taxus chinensis]